MTRCFTTSTDEDLMELIAAAKDRLVIVSPAVTVAVANALAGRMDDLPALSMTLIIDADAEVYRMGFGDPEALEILRAASAMSSFRLREQPGIRIGLVISDEQTLIFAPVSRNVEAGSLTVEKPNAIFLTGPTVGSVVERLAEATGSPTREPTEAREVPPEEPAEEPGAPSKEADAKREVVAEIGTRTLDSARVAAMQADLLENAPQPFDLTRKLNVFITRVQYVELKVKGYQLSRRLTELPPELMDVTDSDLRDRMMGRIKGPLATAAAVEIKITWNGKEEALKVDEKFLGKERQEIERALTHVIPNRGRIILKKDKASLDNQIERFKLIITTYQAELNKMVDALREGFEEQLIGEYLERWKKNPPKAYSRRLNEPNEEELRDHIRRLASDIFDKMVKLDGPTISVVPKEIAFEDLKDQTFMSNLREIMRKGGTPRKVLDRIFETGDAAAASGAFRSEKSKFV